MKQKTIGIAELTVLVTSVFTCFSVLLQAKPLNDLSRGLVLTTLPYPENRDISYTNRISQSYYVVQFVLDNTKIDLCDSSNLIKSMNNIDPRFDIPIQNSSSILDHSICVDYFCDCSIDSNVCFNLTINLMNNSTFRMQYFRMINFCIHCDNFHSQAFRNAISMNNHGQCQSKFPSYESLQTSMLKHCNHKINLQSIDTIISNSSFNTLNFNVGILDWRFFQPGVYYSSIYLSNHSKTTLDNTLHLYNILFVSETVNPVMCWCRNEWGEKFSFQCADAYYTFLLPYKYIGSPIVIFFLFSINLILFIVYIIIPLALTKQEIISSRLKSLIANQATSTFLPNIVWKIIFEELLYSDLRPTILLFLLCSVLLILLENFILFIWNFRFFFDAIGSDLLMGCFRSIAIWCFSFAYISLLVHWGHIVDLLDSSTTKRTLSRRNLIILAAMYAFNIVTLIVGAIGCIILEGTFPLFAVAAICMIVCPNILIVVFSAYSWIIFKKLRHSQKNISELKFTKKMVLFNLVLIVSFLAAAVFLPTYIDTWDLFGIYVGLYRSPFIDVTSSIILLFITYILANDVEISKHYSTSVSDILLCNWFKDNKQNRTSKEKINHGGDIASKHKSKQIQPQQPSNDSTPSPSVDQV